MKDKMSDFYILVCLATLKFYLKNEPILYEW